MNPCIVVPYYNHGGAIGQVVAGLRALGLPCRVVDDGSDAAAQAALRQAVQGEEHWLTVQRLPHNQGKGAAVMAGCDAALAEGFTHAVQIDADGQHRIGDVAGLLAHARRTPHAMVSGCAVYDGSVPRIRFYGRYLTHFWVWVNTLSFEIRDSMCGLRVYPLASTCAVWRRRRIGRRMDFDTEIMVRLSWANVPIISVPTQVTYPLDGVSHFRMLLDNALLTAMHVRLFFGMLWRAPMLLARRMRGRRRKVAT